MNRAKSQPFNPRRSRQAGFSLVSAIFLLVVLVVLGASVVTLSAVQHSTSAVRIQSLRVHYAARAGLEWAIRRIAAPAACNGTFVLGDVNVVVSCSSASHTLNEPPARTYHVVTATATAGAWGGVDYVSRQLQAKVLGP